MSTSVDSSFTVFGNSSGKNAYKKNLRACEPVTNNFQ